MERGDECEHENGSPGASCTGVRDEGVVRRNLECMDYYESPFEIPRSCIEWAKDTPCGLRWNGREEPGNSVLILLNLWELDCNIYDRWPWEGIV